MQASPGLTRDARKMRPLRPSDAGMTAVLAIRQHAVVTEQSEKRDHHHHRRLRHSEDGPGRSPASPARGALAAEGESPVDETHIGSLAFLPHRSEVPAGVIVLRGSGASIFFHGSRCGHDIESQLHWFKPKKPQEARGMIVVMRREMAGVDYEALVQTRRHLQAAGAQALVIVQAEGDAPVVQLSEGDVSASLTIPVVYVKANTLEREAKDGVAAMVMFDAVNGAKQLVADVLRENTPSSILIETDEVRDAFVENDVAYTLPDVHRKVARTLNKTMQGKIAKINGALSGLQDAIDNAHENFAVSIEEVEQRVRVSDGRVLFLEHVIEDMQRGRIAQLMQALKKEKQNSQDLQEQLYKPEVQAILNTKKRKPRESSVASFFDSGRLKQPGQDPMPMPLDTASQILKLTKPGDLANEADFLVGQAAEIAGSEDADVIKIQAKLRLKENSKWFNQWYRLINWRTMSKVIREGTLPLQTTTMKSFQSRELPSITPHRPTTGSVTARLLQTPRSGERSIAPSTPDSSVMLQTKLRTVEKMQEEQVRSFIAEIKALEDECTHWRDTVDKMRQDLRDVTQKHKDEQHAHQDTKKEAVKALKMLAQHAKERQRETFQEPLQIVTEELAKALRDVSQEYDNLQQMQAKAILASAPSRGTRRRTGVRSGASSHSGAVEKAKGRTRARGATSPDKTTGSTLKMTPAASTATQRMSRHEAESIFKRIDSNGNGEISQIEFIKALRQNEGLAKRLGLPSQIKQEEDSRRIFQLAYAEIDKDESKTIQIEEFVDFYASQKPDLDGRAEMLAIEDWDPAAVSESIEKTHTRLTPISSPSAQDALTVGDNETSQLESDSVQSHLILKFRKNESFA